MKIICGTDLSKNSRRSVAAANALATRFKEHLDVVHVMHLSFTENLAAAVREMHVQDCQEALAEIAETLDSRGDRSQTHLRHGHADEELVGLARAPEVSLLVVGSLGHRDNGRWHLGSCAERVAESCHKPTLIVRDDTPFREWGDRRPLKIFVAWNFDEVSENALRQVAEWRRHGPCEITVAHVDWPPEEARRLGVRSDFFSARNDPLVQEVLERDLRERAAAILGEAPEHIVVEGDYSRPDFHFSHIVNEQRPDLVVCGTHQRHGFSRLAHNSFSRGLLHHSRASVLMVPLVKPAAEAIPKIRKVLATTDFSEIGNHAIPTAYAQVRDGGTVYLVHIVDPFHVPSPMVPKYQVEGVSAKAHDQEMKDLTKRLEGLIPAEAVDRGITTDVRVLEGNQLASAICQCAERFGVDLICLGSHGRGGLSRLVLGSVASAVIARSHRPVTVVKPPES